MYNVMRICLKKDYDEKDCDNFEFATHFPWWSHEKIDIFYSDAMQSFAWDEVGYELIHAEDFYLDLPSILQAFINRFQDEGYSFVNAYSVDLVSEYSELIYTFKKE